MERTGREEWRKRVERWRDSGLTAVEFASELGINPHTLSYWKYILRRDAAKAASAPTTVAKRTATPPAMIELRAAVSETRFEIELGRGRRLWVPAEFDPSALKRLMAVMEQS
jgi:transposase-like protein